MEKVKISLIVPDPNQPRKIFEPTRLATLKSSVQKHGILTPIIVEKIKDGKFLIVDGERRYRVASDLGVKDIPIITIDPQSRTDRMIQQFHIQEQHENWNAVEKAQVVKDLADEMDLPLEKAYKILGVSDRQGQRYMAFMSLVDRENFKNNKIDIGWAGAINNLKNTTKKVYNRKLEVEFTKADERKLEHAFVKGLKDGTIVTSHDVTKLKDSFVKDPKSIKSFMSDDATPEGLFLKTKARGAYHLRNINNHSGYVATHIRAFMDNPDVEVDEITLSRVKSALDGFKKFLSKYDN